MLGENAERRRTAPISSAMEWKIFLNISNLVGSGLRIVLRINSWGTLQLFWRQQKLAVVVHTCFPVRMNQRGGTVLGHNRWARENIAGAEGISPVQGGFSSAAIKRKLHDLVR